MGVKMALLLKHIDCHCCGTRHHFGIDDYGWDTATLYEYNCPQTGDKATMRLPLTTTAEDAPHWPQGAVRLRPVGSAGLRHLS